MTKKGLLKLYAYRLAQLFRLVPSVWMLRNPFKIYECQELMREAGLSPTDSILDLGCGRGMQTQLLARSCSSAVGVDTGSEQIAYAKLFLRHSRVAPRVKFLCSTIEQARLPDGSLDKVFSFCVLEHIPNLDEVLKDLHRILRHGGELHVTVDSLSSINDPQLIQQHRREHQVVQYFTPETLNAQLEGAGFRLRECRFIMSGGFATAKFQERIKENQPVVGMFGRRSFVRRLRLEDAASAGKRGIMLLARAESV
jgi:2-polyprenyl-3-methyl-5-hydroxy-6-metoxy-1,4-benzoquinol methylase